MCTIKGFTMDKEGTNTWRYAKAGSKVIVAISPEEVDIIKKTQMALNDLDQIIALLEQEKLDIVFIEGFHSLIAKRPDVPKIITAKNEEGLRRNIARNSGTDSCNYRHSSQNVRRHQLTVIFR